MYLSIVNKTNEPQTQFERERIEILPRRSTSSQSSSYFAKFVRCMNVSDFCFKKFVRGKFFDEINKDYTFYLCSLFYTLSLSLNIQRLHICNTFIYNYSCIL